MYIANLTEIFSEIFMADLYCDGYYEGLKFITNKWYFITYMSLSSNIIFKQITCYNNDILKWSNVWFI